MSADWFVLVLYTYKQNSGNENANESKSFWVPYCTAVSERQAGFWADRAKESYKNVRVASRSEWNKEQKNRKDSAKQVKAKKEEQKATAEAV